MMKPTDEWVSYCADPANAWLQELWEPAVGDWVCAQEGSVGERLSVQAAESYEAMVLQDQFGQYFGTFDDLDELQEWVLSGRYSEGYVVWLPTLSDLLRMTEEALPENERAEMRVLIGNDFAVASSTIYPHPFDADNPRHRGEYRNNRQHDKPLKTAAAELLKGLCHD